MRRVILESPFAGTSRWFGFIQRWRNVRYARACVRDALNRGEAPIASHLLYTQRGILRDHFVGERRWGIDAGLAWRMVAEASVVYIDRGISPGMRYGIAAAKAAGIPVVHRSLTYGGCINVPSAQGDGVTDARSNPQPPHLNPHPQLAHGKTPSLQGGSSA